MPLARQGKIGHGACAAAGPAGLLAQSRVILQADRSTHSRPVPGPAIRCARPAVRGALCCRPTDDRPVCRAPLSAQGRGFEPHSTRLLPHLHMTISLCPRPCLMRWRFGVLERASIAPDAIPTTATMTVRGLAAPHAAQ